VFSFQFLVFSFSLEELSTENQKLKIED